MAFEFYISLAGGSVVVKQDVDVQWTDGLEELKHYLAYIINYITLKE